LTIRIVVEPSGYHCLNMGDVAMMQIAVARLSELWPRAEIGVITSRPDRLLRFCPSVAPISAELRNDWLSGRSLIGGLHRKLPLRISIPLQRLEKILWFRCPVVTDLSVRLKAMIKRRPVPSPSSFRKRVTGADLLVVSGAGMLNDAFADSACPLLDELEFALQAGVPVVAFGQGVGPITDPDLLARARSVLPRLMLISLREGFTGLPILESFGVPRDRIYVTGDDAIELAYRLRPDVLGGRIGINLRLAGYAEAGEDMLDKLREPLLHAAQTMNSSLIPVPISFHESDSDVEANRKLLDSQSLMSQETIETPEDVIHRIGKCRVVVTGSYHGGVFALAQGIPVVGLVHSPYYEQKFTGLQQQFPGGCRILDFRRPVKPVEIQDAIHSAWKSAEQVRESLLSVAARQIELGRAAYQAARRLCPLES
jgi:colanic acid/amylovoran biosynthesis protein